MKYLTNSGLSYFFNKIKTYLTSSTYLNSIGISNTDIDDIADDAGYSSGSLPASEDIFITGDIIPNTDNSVDLGASSKNIKMVYTKGITINGTQFLPSDYIPKAGGAVITGSDLGRTNDTGALSLWGGSDHSGGAKIDLFGKDHSTYSGCAFIRTIDANNNVYQMALKPDGTLTWGSKNVAMSEDVVPRSGGAVMTGQSLGRTVNDSELQLCGGINYSSGASVILYGKDATGLNGMFRIRAAISGSEYTDLCGWPNGSLNWGSNHVAMREDAISEKASRTTTGDWTITGLIPFKPLYIVVDATYTRVGSVYIMSGVEIECVSNVAGTTTWYNASINRAFRNEAFYGACFPYSDGSNRTTTIGVSIPLSSSITLNVKNDTSSGLSLTIHSIKAYQ